MTEVEGSREGGFGRSWGRSGSENHSNISYSILK